MIQAHQRLIIVSNRLPFVLRRQHNGSWQVKAGSGGLVTALAPVLRNRGGVWIGWPGTVEQGPDVDQAVQSAVANAGYDLAPVHLTAEEREGFYFGFANQIVWPLFHDMQSQCNFDPAFWHAYEQVNHKYAAVVASQARADDFIWVHDYHLMEVGRLLRERGLPWRINFFLHIPFPPLDIFLKLPKRVSLLRSLLSFDLVGLQTQRDRRNFLQCVRVLLPDADIASEGGLHVVYYHGRAVRVGSFPIGIDYKGFDTQARSDDVARRARDLHADMPERQIMLGVDRLDYTKGIVERLLAFRHALATYPELQRKLNMVQIVVPSRTDIPMYQTLKERLERLVGEINGQYTQTGWVPIHYIFRSLDFHELLAYYRAAEIMLVTSLKDGMNLVAKEYCACDVDLKGALVLSEFTGAAYEMRRNALLVNPYDIEGTAEAIREAFLLPAGTRQERMRRLRRMVESHDIFWWVSSFMRAAIAKDLTAFPVLDELSGVAADAVE